MLVHGNIRLRCGRSLSENKTKLTLSLNSKNEKMKLLAFKNNLLLNLYFNTNAVHTRETLKLFI